MEKYTDYTNSLYDGDYKTSFIDKTNKKSAELIDKFKRMVDGESETAKFLSQLICATIVVDEILKVIPMYTGNLNPEFAFWQQVRLTIENCSTTLKKPNKNEL